MIPHRRKPSSTDRSRGIAMVAALGLMAVASAVMVLLFMRTMDELRHGQDDAGIVQTLLVAHGGANLGVSLLRADVRERLDQIATLQSDTTGSWSFGTSGAGATEPTPSSVAGDLVSVAVALQTQIDSVVCGDRTFDEGQVLTLRIHVTDTACGEALPAGSHLGDGRFVEGNRREQGGVQRYALPFIMVSEGVQGDYRRRVVTQGEYLFDVGRASFARYALFTDRHVSDVGGGRIWFTADTLFDGPVHTNGNFNFYNRPWFGGQVTSAGVTQGHGQGAFGYNSGDGSFFSATTLDPGGNSPDLSTGGYTNRPEFMEGVDWRSTYIDLPDNAHDQRSLANDAGILFTQPIEYLEIFAADSAGNPVLPGSTPPAAYQYVRASVVQGGSSTTITYRIDPTGRLERHDGDLLGTWDTITENFNGVIYSDEYIPRLRGPGRTNNSQPNTAQAAVAAFAQLTIVPQAGARITSDLVYEDQPCTGSLHRDADNQVVRATCENLDATNVLGVFSPSGNIQIGNFTGDSSTNAPNDVRIQASLLTSNGVVRVENYNSGSPRGAVQLLGGIIEERYGAFGTFNAASGTMSTGYAREFTFDPRLRRGLTPPYFPTVGVDGVKDVFTYTFGHREQVY